MPDERETVHSYPPARAVAAELRALFARRPPDDAGEEPGPVPDADTIEEVITAGFWASLQREEGLSPRISLALLPPELAAHPLLFGRRLPLRPDTLARVAPAVERPGIHLGVWTYGSGLCVWGATRTIPENAFVLEVVEPGLLVVKRRAGRDASAKYANLAVLQGDRVKIIDQRGGDVPDCLPLIASMMGFDAHRAWLDPTSVILRLAISMRAHGRGGVLLLVPEASRAWLESIVQPILYPVVPPFSGLAGVLRGDAGDRTERRAQEALRRAVDVIAGLTAVDGAAVMNDAYELLAFGAKIARRNDSGQVPEVRLTEPVVGVSAAVVEPSHLGGTRHLSAAQFVYDQRDAMALVASQDGRFTVFTWSACVEMVHAHRVETLML